MGKRLASALEQLIHYPGYWIHPRHPHAWHMPPEADWPKLLRPLVRLLVQLQYRPEGYRNHCVQERSVDLNRLNPTAWSPYWRTRKLVEHWQDWRLWREKEQEKSTAQGEFLVKLGVETWVGEMKPLYESVGEPQLSQILWHARQWRCSVSRLRKRQWVDEVDRLFVSILYPLMELKARTLLSVMEKERLLQFVLQSRVPDPNLSETQLQAQQLLLFPALRETPFLPIQQNGQLVLEWLERTELLDGTEFARLAWCCFWYAHSSSATSQGHLRLNRVAFRDPRQVQSCRIDLAVHAMDWRRVLFLVREALDSGWQQLELYSILAQALFTLGHFEEAEQVCRSVLRTCGFAPRLAFTLGFSLLENPEALVTDAQRCFEWIRTYFIRIDRPFPTDLLFGLSRVYSHLGRYELVRMYLQMLKKQQPELMAMQPALQANLLEANVALGDWPEVERLLKMAEERGSEHPLYAAYTLLLKMRKGEGDPEYWIAQMERLERKLTEHPRWVETGMAAQIAHLFSHVLYERGQLEAALTWAHRCMQWGSQNEASWFQMAQVLQGMGQEDWIQALLRQAKQELAPFLVNLLQASLALGAGDFARAEEWIDQAEQLSEGRRDHDVLEMRIELALVQGLENDYAYWCNEFRKRCPAYALPPALKKNPWDREEREE